MKRGRIIGIIIGRHIRRGRIIGRIRGIIIGIIIRGGRIR